MKMKMKSTVMSNSLRARSSSALAVLALALCVSGMLATASPAAAAKPKFPAKEGAARIFVPSQGSNATAQHRTTPGESVFTPDWSSSYGGVTYGVATNPWHVWVIAPYQALMSADIAVLAGAVCSPTGIFAVPCGVAIGGVFYNLSRGQARVTNHGIWASIYVSGWHWWYQGGRY